MALLTELKNRGVTRVVAAYVALAWLVLQVAEMLLPVYGFGDTAIRNLVTVLAAGLPVAIACSWFFEWTSKGVVREETLRAADRQSEGGSASSHRLLDRFTILVLGLAVAFFMVDKFMLDPDRDQAREKAVAEQARADALTGSFGDRSIAVLPFRDLSPAGDQGYFSEGVAEEVLNLLATIPELRVIGRASAFAFKDKNEPIAGIARQLNVAHVLDGSVRKAGSRVRITVQLVEGKTETQLWSKNFDRAMDDIFALQDEIAAQVTSELRIRLLGGMVKAKAISPEAFEDFLKARHLMRNFTWQVAEQQETKRLLRGVLEREPDYLPALALLWRAEEQTLRGPPGVREAELQRLRDRMIEIDPDHVDTLRIQASMAWQAGEHPQVVASLLERALRVDSSNVELLRTTIYALMAAERFDDAIAVGNHLVLREPACGRCISVLANAYRGARRFDEGVGALNMIAGWGPVSEGFYWNLGVLYLGAGKPGQTIAAWQQEKADFGEVWWLLALYDLGAGEEFESRFAAFRDDPTQHPESIARVYAHMGNADLAFEWLVRMFDPASEVDPVYVGSSEIYDPIKSDPRWQTLMERFGTVDIGDMEIRFELPPELTDRP